MGGGEVCILLADYLVTPPGCWVEKGPGACSSAGEECAGTDRDVCQDHGGRGLVSGRFAPLVVWKPCGFAVKWLRLNQHRLMPLKFTFLICEMEAL